MLKPGLGLICLAVVLGSSFWSGSPSAMGAAGPSASLTGTVSSDAEGPMEGVLVTAQRKGSTISVTVVSDATGRFSFPPGRLEAGKYSLRARAAGYELADPGAVEVAAGKTTEAKLKLLQTRNLAAQLTSAEWLLSVPGSQEQKAQLYQCVSCHSLFPVLASRHDAKSFLPVIGRMRNHAPPSSLFRPGVYLPFQETLQPKDTQLAEYLSTVNLSSASDGKWKYELKTLPRPKGKATRVIVTEYDLPRKDIMPHDAAVAKNGMVWYSDFGGSNLGRLDPRSGEVKEWKVPARKPEFPQALLDIKFDQEGNVWTGTLFQGSIAKMNPKTEAITMYQVPPEHDTVRTRTGMLSISQKTGMVWFISNGELKIFGLDPQQGKVIALHQIPPNNPPANWYGMEIDSQDRLYLFGMRGSILGTVDTATGKVETFPTPTARGGPRRGDVDSQDRAWFAEYYSGKIGMFDPQTKRIQEWDVPVPWGGSYDVVVDKNGEVWSGGMHTDYIFRLHPKSGQVTAYLLPTRNANMRRIDVDNSGRSVTVWVGENHQAKIAKLEFPE